MGPLTHGTKKNLLVNVQQGWSSRRNPPWSPRGCSAWALRPRSCIPCDAPGPMGVEHAKPRRGDEVDVIDWGFHLLLSCLPISHPISHPSSARCVF